MDLSTLDMAKFADEGSILEVLHPATLDVQYYEGEPVSIKLLGQDSNAFRQFVQRRARNAMNKRQKLDIDKLSSDAAELYATLTIGWHGITEGNQPVECTFDNAKRIYEKHGWLRQQIDEFVSDRANFFKA
jgi:hypothetical protein